MVFVAEIGINHNGSIEMAKELIRVAKQSGADFVKFQKRDIDLSVPNNTKWKVKETPWGRMTYYDYRRKLEFGKTQYDMINAFCMETGIRWTASVWDVNSLEFILQYDVPYIKVPSACIANLELLRKIRKANVPVMMSIGMSTIAEIKRAIGVLGRCDLTILHCNSSYPAKDSELDLRVIQTLKRKYPDHKIGYSSHDSGIYPCLAAAALGAEVIEKHITLDKSLWGTDQKASLVNEEITELVSALKKIPVWLGNNAIRLYESEKEVRKKLRVENT